MMLLPENSKIIPAWTIQTMDSGATGDWVSLKNYARCMIVLLKKQGHASAGDITVDKATDVSGSNEVAGITINNWWYLTDYTLGVSSSSELTKGAAGTAITTDNSATGTNLYVIDIDAAELVSAGTNYDCIQVNLGSSNAANLSVAFYVLYNPRYTELPEAISD